MPEQWDRPHGAKLVCSPLGISSTEAGEAAMPVSQHGLRDGGARRKASLLGMAFSCQKGRVLVFLPVVLTV